MKHLTFYIWMLDEKLWKGAFNIDIGTRTCRELKTYIIYNYIFQCPPIEKVLSYY